LDLTEAINRFRGPLVGLIVSWGAPRNDAIELAQDSFADAYLKRDACRGDWTDPEIFGPWLRGVAKNNYRNWRRTTARRQRRLFTVEPDVLAESATDSEAVEDARLPELRNAIERLPRKQREAIIMHYLEETSVNDVAALLSVTAKTVEGRLYQARKSLRKLMDKSPPKRSIGRALLL
jgi:RNA polymerase sigma-70 factor (ECF subfamily)